MPKQLHAAFQIAVGADHGHATSKATISTQTKAKSRDDR
jgi:hypothetical protein